MNCRNVSLLTFALFVGTGCDGTKAGSALGDVTTPGTGGNTTGGSSTGGSSPRPTPPGTTRPTGDASVPPDETTPDAGPPANISLPHKPGSVPGGRTPPTAPIVCSRETTGLSLAQLLPTAASPAAFRSAWKQELLASVAPPLVLGLRNLTRGPVTGSLGPVHAVSPTTWHFEAPPLTARTVMVTLDTTNPLRIKVPTLPTTAITSFGDSNERRGFTITAFSLDGILGGQCESLVGIAHFVIPGSNAAQPFAGTTVGALLGAFNVDTDTDGAPDAWAVDLTGTASFVTVESTP